MDVLCFPERQSSTELRRHLGVEAIGDVMRGSRLRWHGHAERKGDADYVKACTRLVVDGTVMSAGQGTPGRPRC